MITVTMSMRLDDQLTNALAAAELWREWAEEEGVRPDVDAFMREVITWIRDGSAWVLVAWCDGIPTGMGIVHRHYDCWHGQWRAVGERLYVSKRARGSGVMRQMGAAAEFFSIMIGASVQVVSAQVNNPGLIAWYEGLGFTQREVTLTRPPRNLQEVNDERTVV